MAKRNVAPDEFEHELEAWMRDSREALIDIFYPRSGGGGTLYLLNSPDQVTEVLKFAQQNGAKYKFQQAVITAFRSAIFPLRGIVDEEFLETIRKSWSEGRSYYMVDLARWFPEQVLTVGSGDTKEELEKDLSELLGDSKGRNVGFGEHPFDEDDWAERNNVELIETTIVCNPENADTR